MLTYIFPYFWLLAITLGHFVVLISTRFTLWPEMLAYPYLLNNGFLLYTDIISPYPPLMINLLSAFTKQFSYDVVPIQILTWSTIFIIDLSIFFLSLKITKNKPLSFASLLFFVIFSVPLGVNGIWFDLFQTIPILFSTFYFYRYLQSVKNKLPRTEVLGSLILARFGSDFLIENRGIPAQNKRNLILAFCFLALAASIKQQAAWILALFTFLGLLTLKKSKKNIFHFLLLSLVPFTITVALLTAIFLRPNIFGDFLLWTVYFPFLKSSSLPGYILFPTLKQLLTLFVLILIFAPLIVRKNLKESYLVLTGFILFIFAYPRFDYFHLIPALSVLSLSFGKNIQYLASSNLKIKLISISAILLLVIFSIRYFQRNWTGEIRFFEKDIYQAAKFVEIVNPKGTPIFLQNVPGQIFVISNTLPTKPWADSFPWYLENPNIQEKVLEGIKKDKPAFVIYKPYQHSGDYDLASYRPQKIADYLDQNYKDSFRINEQLFLRAKTTK